MLASLDNARPTLHNLHTAARLLGTIRLLLFGRQQNFLELGLKIKPEGLSTDLLPTGSEVTLDFCELAFIYQSATGAAIRISIIGETQASLLETLLKTIYPNELASTIPHDANESYTDSVFKAVESFVNRIKPKQSELSESSPLSFDAQAACAYANSLYSIFTGLARFHARLNGSLTPAVVWPEHFDLSFLWFTGQPDEQHPHLNFGFSPFSAGIDHPYLYAYAYPYPAQFDVPKLPEGAHWNSAGWIGVVLPYTEIAQQTDPVQYVETASITIFRSLCALLD